MFRTRLIQARLERNVDLSLLSQEANSTLDIGLRSLPNPRRLVAFGVDQPTYFSVHSAVAKLAPALAGDG